MNRLMDAIDGILEPLRSWVLDFRDDQGRYRYFRDSRKPYCLYATIEGLALEDLLGLTPDPESRRKAYRFVRDSQSAEDGYFRCRTCAADAGDEPLTCLDANKDGLTFKAAATLFASGAAPLHPLPEGNVITGNIARKLAAIFAQNNPYSAGSVVWRRTGMYALKLLAEHKDPAEDPYVSAIMNWLGSHQDPESGLWFAENDLMNGVNGLLKMRYGTFDPCGEDIPNPEKIVSVILSLQSSSDGAFGDWNAAGLLADLGRRVPSRRDAILAAYSRLMPAMRAKRDPHHGGLAWASGGDASLKSTFINATGLLAMRYFIVGDNPGLDRIFFPRAVRRRLLQETA